MSIARIHDSIDARDHGSAGKAHAVESDLGAVPEVLTENPSGLRSDGFESFEPEWTDRFIPKVLQGNLDEFRRARLMIGFTGVGVFFGLVYIIFYLLVEHRTGAGIIGFCVGLLSAVPWVMRKTNSLTTSGHLICLITMSGFTALTAVEGGALGHAISWLATGSLIALLLLGRKAGLGWALTGFSLVFFFCALEFLGIRLPMSYPEAYAFTITAAGYLGLVTFLFILGAIFEKWRSDAHQRLEDAGHRLTAANDRLTSLNQEKTEFLGIAAHDLRNPLSTIMLCGEMIAMQTDPKITSEMCRRMVKEAARMRDLLNELLDVNAIETGSTDFTPTEVDLRDVTSEICRGFDLRMEEKHQHLEIEFPESQTPHVYADRRALLHVFENLMSNAVKFSPPGGHIAISIRLTEGQVEWSVTDSGPGVSDQDRPRLFKKFAKLSARPTAGENSIGLGLSIVKRYVENMGGSILCRNIPGAGACFTVIFNVVRPMDEKPA